MVKKFKVSIVIPVYKPEKDVFAKLKSMLNKQTIDAEIIENWNMPEAKSMNTGIMKAQGEIIVTLAQDCIPEDEFWLEKLIKPLEKKDVVTSISDLHLPEEYWKKQDFLTRIFTLSDRKDKTPGFDARGCAYRKKDIIESGLFDEDPKVIAIDLELGMRLNSKGELFRAGVKILHLHKINSFVEVIKKIFIYSEANGKAVRQKKWKLGLVGLWIRITKAFPFLGIVHILGRFPFKKYFYLFPIYFFIAIPLIHVANVLGFWKGLFFDKESIRNLKVLEKN